MLIESEMQALSASQSCVVKVEVASTVGVPDINPAPLMLRPVGNDPTVTE
jgi:hypothetical protein